jgi:hypothetical protein
MGCSCRVPAEKYPENAEWGPLFWILLHSLAERAGKQPDALLQGDEVRLWVKTLNSVADTLPCDVCSRHYKEYLAENPPEAFLTVPYSNFGHTVRMWLWTLHNRINEGNDKPVFPFENLSVYKDTDLTRGWKALQPVIHKAISLNGVSWFPWRAFLANVRALQGLYG